jgi:integration host factor subunit beta
MSGQKAGIGGRLRFAIHKAKSAGEFGHLRRLGKTAMLGGLLRMTNTTTTKKDLIDRIADQTAQKRTAVKRTVQCFLDNVIRELQAGHRLEFRDFGVFEVRDRAPRMGQNPKTLERVPVPARKTVKFKIGRLMKSVLDGEEFAMHVDYTENGFNLDEE